MSKILIVSPVPTHPLTAGNHVRVFAVANELRRQGHDVTFVHVPWCPGSRRQMRRYWGDSLIRTRYRWPRSTRLGILCSRATQALGLSFLHRWTRKYWLRNRPLDTWYDPRLDVLLRRLDERHRFDVVMVEYVMWSRALTAFGQTTLKVLDTHDIFADRYGLLEKATDCGRFWPWGSVSLDEDDERRGLRRADVVLAIQAEEAARLRSMTDRPVAVVGHILHDLRLLDGASEGTDLLFVASAWSPNVDAVLWFTREILPQVRRRAPLTRLLVAGRVCDRIPNIAGCEKLGVVSDVAEAYQRAAVVVNPVQSGTGLAIKSIEALGYGRPLVASPCGARGLAAATGHGMHVAETPEEWTTRLVALLKDGAMRASEGRKAHEFARNWNSRQFSPLASLLSTQGPKTPGRRGPAACPTPAPRTSAGQHHIPADTPELPDLG